MRHASTALASSLHCGLKHQEIALFKWFTSHFYEELMRLGSSGIVIGFSGSFVLSGTIQKSLAKRRDKLSFQDITSAMQCSSSQLPVGYAYVSILFGQKTSYVSWRSGLSQDFAGVHKRYSKSSLDFKKCPGTC